MPSKVFTLSLSILITRKPLKSIKSFVLPWTTTSQVSSTTTGRMRSTLLCRHRPWKRSSRSPSWSAALPTTPRTCPPLLKTTHCSLKATRVGYLRATSTRSSSRSLLKCSTGPRSSPWVTLRSLTLSQNFLARKSS